MRANFAQTYQTIKRQAVSDKRQREQFAIARAKERRTAIVSWYERGGEEFLEWTKQNYRTYAGEALIWNEPFLEDFYRLMGHPWLEKIVVSKSAQIGYTEGLIALAAFALSRLQVSIGFGFEEEQKLRDMVGSRVQPSFDHCEPIQRLSQERRKATRREDIDSQKSITVGGVAKASFFYACVKSKSHGQQTPATLRSFSASLIFADEYSLWPKGVLDTATARMNASPLPTQLLRAGSTPSFEGSTLDTDIKRSKFELKWEVTCPHCQGIQFLAPFGNLLQSKLIKNGDKEEMRHVSPMGRPYRWFHHSVNPDKLEDWQLEGASREEAIASTYLGCQLCFRELPAESLDRGRFVCERTGVTLKELCDRREVVRQTIVLHLPRLASKRFIPSQRIRRLIETDNPSDEIQQQLGQPISLGSGKIALGQLLACVGKPLPPELAGSSPTLRLMGFDQGRPGYGLIADWYYGEGEKKDAWWRNARVQVIWFGEITTFEELDAIAKEYNVDAIGADNEPEFQLACQYALEHLPSGTLISTLKKPKKGQVYLFDQVALKGEQFKRTTRSIKNTAAKTTQVPIYLLDRTWALDAVRDRIIGARFHVAVETTYEPTVGNFLYHFTTSERDDEGFWTHAPSTPDHYHHAASFMEALAIACLFEPGVNKLAFCSVAME